MKEYNDVSCFVGKDEPIRGSIESIKDILCFLNTKCRLSFSDNSPASYEVVRAYTTSAYSIISKLQDYLEESGEILPF